MMVFDTSAAIGFLRGDKGLRSLVKWLEDSGDLLVVTTVSLFELLSPIEHRRLVREEKAVKAFLQGSVILGLDSNSATEASKIMGSLLRLGIPINALDALISGIAVANGAETLVTSDRDFEKIAKVANLKIRVLR